MLYLLGNEHIRIRREQALGIVCICFDTTILSWLISTVPTSLVLRTGVAIDEIDNMFATVGARYVEKSRNARRRCCGSGGGTEYIVPILTTEVDSARRLADNASDDDPTLPSGWAERGWRVWSFVTPVCKTC